MSGTNDNVEQSATVSITTKPTHFASRAVQNEMKRTRRDTWAILNPAKASMIKPLDILMTGVSDGSPWTTRDKMVEVFASFAGQSYDKGKSHAEIQMDYKVMGVAGTPFDFNSPTQPNNNMNCIIGGSTSILNNSGEAIHAGDLVRARIPALHTPENGNYDANYQENQRRPLDDRDRQTVIVEPFHDDYMNEFEKFVGEHLPEIKTMESVQRKAYWDENKSKISVSIEKQIYDPHYFIEACDALAETVRLCLPANMSAVGQSIGRGPVSFIQSDGYLPIGRDWRDNDGDDFGNVGDPINGGDSDDEGLSPLPEQRQQSQAGNGSISKEKQAETDAEKKESVSKRIWVAMTKYHTALDNLRSYMEKDVFAKCIKGGKPGQKIDVVLML